MILLSPEILLSKFADFGQSNSVLSQSTLNSITPQIPKCKQKIPIFASFFQFIPRSPQSSPPRPGNHSGSTEEYDYEKRSPLLSASGPFCKPASSTVFPLVQYGKLSPVLLQFTWPRTLWPEEFLFRTQSSPALNLSPLC